MLALFSISFSTFVFSTIDGNFSGWAHLELGARNYGPDGHTKISQAMTILMKINDVSNEKNYIMKNQLDSP